MAASTAPAVKAALLTLLQADSGLSNVQIQYSDPGSAIQQEAIFYGRVISSEHPEAMGQRKQREDYEIEVYVYNAQDGDDAQACEERCWALVARLEVVVRANNNSTGALSNALTGGGWVAMAGVEVTPFIHKSQRVCEALCKVRVAALKTP